MSGLVTFKSTSQILDEEKKKAEELYKQNEYADVIESQLSNHIRKVWERNRRAKMHVYERLLYCLRARKGTYSEGELQQIKAMGGADPIYLKLTGTKCRAAASWVRDILLPIKALPFGIESTPIPELPKDVEANAMQQAITEIQKMMAEGMQMSPEEQQEFQQMVTDKIKSQLKITADLAVKNVQTKIEDAMEDGGYKKAMEDFIEDFVTYPFACMKGPYYQPKTFLSWEGGKAIPKKENVLCWRRVSPFDIFYSPYAKNMQEGDLIERIRLTRESLYNLLGQDGYKDNEIREVLQQHDLDRLENWIWDNFEKETLENNSAYFLTDKDTIDGLHFWGHVKGSDLSTWGYAKPIDPDKMYYIDAILIGKNVIRAVINSDPMGTRPYHSACWDSVPGSIVGVGLPEQMEDHQRMVNSTARALATNMSIGAGPQVAILTDMMAAGEDITGIYPLKIWQMRSSITGNSGKPIEFFQPEIKSQELLSVLSQFEQKADDVTNVPRYSYGNEKIGGAGSTATGLSMLMNSAAKGIRRAIANIDLNVIQPTVYQAFCEIMTVDPDPDIRGDVKVVAKGSAAILIKEQMHENFKEFLQITTNDLDIAIMGKRGRARLLANIAEELGIDPLVLPSDKELEMEEQKEKAMAEAQQQAEIEATKAQAVGADRQAAMQNQVEAMQVQQEAAQVEQKAAQVDEADKQVKAKASAVDSQAKSVQQEYKKLSQMQRQIEEQMAKLSLEKMNIEMEKTKAEAAIEAANIKREVEEQETLAAIEKAKMDLQMEGEKLKALEQKIKIAKMSEEQLETATEKPEEKKKKADKEKAGEESNKAVQKALTEVLAVLKSASGPKSVTLQKDKDGKIIGATSTPIK